MELKGAPAAIEDVASGPRTRYGLGLCGLALAVLGLVLAIARPYVAEVLEPPPKPESKISEVVADAGAKFVDRMIDRVRGKSAPPRAAPAPMPQPPERLWLLILSIAATSLGLAGSLSGTVGWIRREDSRLAGSAIAIGALAVAWIYLMAALVTALVIVFLILIVSTLNWTV